MLNRDFAKQIYEHNNHILQILKSRFGPEAQEFKNSNDPIHFFVNEKLLATSDQLSYYIAECDKTRQEISKIWSDVDSDLKNLLVNQQNQKFLIPAPWTFQQMASRIGCFTDIILIPDQTMVTLNSGLALNFGRVSEILINYLGIANGESALCPQDGFPLAVVIAEHDTRYADTQIIESVSRRLLSEITGLVFSDFKDVMYFLNNNINLENFSKEIRNPKNIPGFNQPDDRTNPLAAWSRFSRYQKQGLYNNPLPLNSMDLYSTLFYSVSQCLGAGKVASSYHSELALDRHLYDLHAASHRTLNMQLAELNDEIIASSLMTKELSWLDNLTINDVMKLRENSTVSELRQLILSSLRRLGDSEPKDITKIAQSIQSELENAFHLHEKNLKLLKTEYINNRKQEAAGIIVSGVIAATALVWPIAGVIGSITGGSALISLYRSEMSFRSKRNKLIRSPIGVLFDSYKQ